MRRWRVWMILLLATAGLARADTPPAAQRIEVHALSTLDIGGMQLLNGQTEGVAATVAGELRLPRGTRQKVPAVIFLHGDAGAIGNQPVWIDDLNRLGIAVFTVDSFSSRGAVSATPAIGSIDGAQPISPLARVVDAQRALTLLSQHPRIDATRIALMGVSSGGRTVLSAAIRRFSEPFATPGVSFAAFIALYPSCNLRFIDDTRLLAAPLRIHHGGADNVTLAEPCGRLVERLRDAGHDAEITVHPGAHHGFDNPLGVPLLRVDGVPSTSGCEYEERTRGEIVNVQTGQAPGLDDPCITRGFSGGYDAAANAATRAGVADFLRQHFKLGD